MSHLPLLWCHTSPSMPWSERGVLVKGGQAFIPSDVILPPLVSHLNTDVTTPPHPRILREQAYAKRAVMIVPCPCVVYMM